MLLLLGTVGLMGWFVKIKVVLKAFRVVATVVVVTCVVVVVVVVVVDVVVVVEGCSAACWRFVVLEINGAAVAGSKFGSGVSLPAKRGSVLNSPENKKIKKGIQDWMRGQLCFMTKKRTKFLPVDTAEL